MSVILKNLAKDTGIYLLGQLDYLCVKLLPVAIVIIKRVTCSHTFAKLERQAFLPLLDVRCIPGFEFLVICEIVSSYFS
jgi:hypothetical protein